MPVGTLWNLYLNRGKVQYVKATPAARPAEIPRRPEAPLDSKVAGS